MGRVRREEQIKWKMKEQEKHFRVSQGFWMRPLWGIGWRAELF